MKYKEQLDAAEQFSVDKVLGVWIQCGRFRQPIDSDASPSTQQIQQAYLNQLNQGQLLAFPGAASIPPQLDPAPTEALLILQPASTEPSVAPNPQPSGECDPSYPDVCIDPVWVSGNLDCGDVPFIGFTFVQPDPHRFDGDFDDVCS